jgi:hypothetical protein
LSIFVSDHDFVKRFIGYGVTNFRRFTSFVLALGRVLLLPGSRRAVCAKSAQEYAIPEQAEQTRCQPAAHRRVMGKIIIIQFRRSRLPRRLWNDGWWLEAPPVRSSVIALPKRDASALKPKIRHLTLIHSGK